MLFFAVRVHSRMLLSIASSSDISSSIRAAASGLMVPSTSRPVKFPQYL